MKKLIVVLMVITPSVLFGQSQKLKSLLRETIELMKSKSANSTHVDWTVLTNEAYERAKNAKKPEGMGNSARFLLQSLDDFHGSIRYGDSTFRWRKPGTRIKMTDLYKKAFDAKEDKLLQLKFDKIGYLRIPSVKYDKAKQMATEIRNELCKILESQPKGLIFDLRLNGGGHSNAMLMGISNIFEYGPIWPGCEIRKDGFYCNSVNEFPLDEKCEKNFLGIPIAVITGPFTASASEFLTIALKTRANTKQIGEPTAGWVTSVDGMKIQKDAHLNITIGYMTDIKGTQYKSRIQPDILVEGGDNFFELKNDSKVLKALEWINNK